MRIISGKLKGKRLIAPKKLPVRPNYRHGQRRALQYFKQSILF